MVTKKIPVRMCTGCGEHKEKKQLIRVVREQSGEISIDFKGKKAGRGAYICNNPSCLQKARKARRLERAFSSQIPEEVYARLEEELQKGE